MPHNPRMGSGLIDFNMYNHLLNIHGLKCQHCLNVRMQLQVKLN